MGRTVKTLPFGAIGGFIGGLFTAGAFSSLGASLGVALAGRQKVNQSSSFNTPEILPETGEMFIRQFAGTVGDVQARVIRVGKNSKGEQAGVFVKIKKKSAGKGATTSEEQYFLMMELEIGRAMGGYDDSPDPLFVDKLEIEDSDGRECIWDRSGSTDDERGLTLTQTISGVTGRVICETSDTVRFYTGTDEQMPDSAMVEFYPDGLPADRGIAKICFNRYPVKSAPTIYVTVRGERDNRRELLTAKFGDVGIDAERLQLDAIDEDSAFKGVKVEGFTTVRDFAERAARRLFCDWAFDGARLVVQSRLNPTIYVVDTKTLGVWRDAEEADESGDGRLILKARGATEMCSEVRVNFPNSNQNYEDDIAFSPQPRASWQNALQYDLGEVESMQAATQFAYALRDEDWNNDEQGQFSVMPGSENWLAGDVLRIDRGQAGSVGTEAPSLPPREYLLLEAEREGNGVQNCSFAPYAAHVYTQPIIVVGPVASSPSVKVFQPPSVLVYDGPVFEERDPDTRDNAYLVAFISGQPGARWEGGAVNLGKQTDTNGETYGNEGASDRAVIGELTASWEIGELTLQVKTLYGELSNASSSDALATGGNLLAFASGLLIQFESATVTDFDPDSGEISYTLAGLRVGRYGSEPYIDDIASGTRFALARDADGDLAAGVLFFPLFNTPKGRALRATARTANSDATEKIVVDLEFQARNRDALAPTLESASRAVDGALLLSGRARWRGILNNTVTTTSLIEKTEPRFFGGYKYRVELDGGPGFDLFAADDEGSFDLTITAAQLGALASSNVAGTIAMYGTYGPGKTTNFEALL